MSIRVMYFKLEGFLLNVVCDTFTPDKDGTVNHRKQTQGSKEKNIHTAYEGRLIHNKN